jgi:predicted esterase
MDGFHRATTRFSFEKNYLTATKPIGKETELWLVLHGYGQLATYFLRKFRHLIAPDRLIVAPEGLNRFYQEGYSGRVGANWMTSHERENDIANCQRYLDEVVNDCLEQIGPAPHIHVLGFSQGAATASRWVAHTSHPVTSLTLWGGGLAHDLDLDTFRKKISATNIVLVLGRQDTFMTPSKIQEQEALWKHLQPMHTSTIQYEGGHELMPHVLTDIFNRCV